METQVRLVGSTGQTGTGQVRPVAPTGQTGSDQGHPKILKLEHPKMSGGKDHNKHKGKKPKLRFAELLAKYLKENEAKRANQSHDFRSSRLPPKLNAMYPLPCNLVDLHYVTALYAFWKISFFSFWVTKFSSAFDSASVIRLLALS